METKGVRILQGDPKKAIRKLAVPMMFGMLVQTLYNLVDGIWVAGLGKDALAAIGFFFPVYMIIVSLASGLSVGGSSAISRKIGAKNKHNADLAAIHVFILSLLIGFVIVFITYPFIHNIFRALGASGHVLYLVITYAQVMVFGMPVIFFSNVAAGILRGEGDMKRTMYVMILASVLNIILDPIFIYVLSLGIIGAALATIFSIFLSALFMFKWLFISKSTYVTFNFKHFKFDLEILKDILKVGLPSTFSQLSMALAVFFINMVIVNVAGSDGIAIFTSSWRILMFGIVPLVGISMGLTGVTGAAYGAKDIRKLKVAYFYGLKYGFIVELLVAITLFLFASQIAFLFTYSQTAKELSVNIKESLHILSLFLPGVPLGMLTSSMFQGIGKGINSFVVTFIRTILFQIFFTYLFAIVFKLNLLGVWYGLVIANLSASLFAFIWGIFVIKKLKNKFILLKTMTNIKNAHPKGEHTF